MNYMKLAIFSVIFALMTSLIAIESPQVVPTLTRQPSVIFDLNGVLFDTDTTAVLHQLGLKDVLWYLARYRSPRMLKTRFFETLHRIAPTRTIAHDMKDPDGEIMPPLMIEWLRGTRPNNVILSQITIAIADNPHWFSSAVEQRLMTAMAHAIFDPEKFIASRKLLSDLAPLIIQLKQRGIKLYVLSNWDKESFALLKKRFPYVFMWFDGCIISGEVGYVKPEHEIYTHVMTKTVTIPLCFLDDQQENLDASKKAGWHTVLVNKTTSYFNFGARIDTENIKKNVLLFLEKHMEQIIDVQINPLKEQTHAIQ